MGPQLPEKLKNQRKNSDQLKKPVRIPSKRLKPSRSRRLEPTEEEPKQKSNLSTLIGCIIVLAVLYIAYSTISASRSQLQRDSKTKTPQSFFSLIKDREINPITEEIIRRQLGQVNQKIEELVSIESNSLSAILEHNYARDLREMQIELSILSNQLTSSMPSQEKLQSLATRVDRLVQDLPSTKHNVASLQTKLESVATDLRQLQHAQATYQILSSELNNQKIQSENNRKQTENNLNAMKTHFNSQLKQYATNQQLAQELQSTQTRFTEFESHMQSVIDKNFNDLRTKQAKFVTREEMNKFVEDLLLELDRPLTADQIKRLVQQQFDADRAAQPAPLTPEEIVQGQKQAIKAIIDVTIAPYFQKLKNLEETDEFSRISAKISEEVMSRMYRLVYEDSIGKPDYALAAVGGEVIDFTGKWSINRFVSAVSPFSVKPHPPSIVLESGNEVGNCWAFAGAQAFLTIRLAKSIYPESISLDHISPNVALNSDLSSAPREFRVQAYGTDDRKPFLLGTFEYDKSKGQVQNFLIEVC